MRKTALCLVPTKSGNGAEVVSLSHEYIRFCSGVLDGRFRVRAYSGSDLVFSDATYNLDSVVQSQVTAPNIFTGMIAAMQWLCEATEPAFRVGRFILLFNDESHFVKAPVPLDSDYLHNWIQKSLDMIQKENLQFDQLDVDIVVFSNSGFHDNLTSGSNGMRRAIIAPLHRSFAVGRDMALNHVGMSTLSCGSMRLGFMDCFEVSHVEASHLTWVPRSSLLRMVDRTYNCVPWDIDAHVMNELARNVGILDDSWMFSFDNGMCQLSVLGKTVEDIEIAKYAFDKQQSTSVASRMPPVLRISQTGKMWIFRRDVPSPALVSLTQLKNLDLILYSREFLMTPLARDIVVPILDALGRPEMVPEHRQRTEMCIRVLFDTIASMNTSLIPTASYNGDIASATLWFDALLCELDVVFTAFGPASEDHNALRHFFQAFRRQFIQMSNQVL